MALLQCLLHHPGEVGAHIQGLPRGLSGKESACNAGDPGSILGSGRSPGIGSGSSLQYSCLGNFTDRGAWQATVHGVAKSWAQLSSRGTKANVLKAVIESGDICHSGVQCVAKWNFEPRRLGAKNRGGSVTRTNSRLRPSCSG